MTQPSNIPVLLSQNTYLAIQKVWARYQVRMKRLVIFGATAALATFIFGKSLPKDRNLFAVMAIGVALPPAAWIAYASRRDCKREGALCPACGATLLQRVEWNAFPGGMRGTCGKCKSVLEWTDAQRPLAEHLLAAPGSNRKAAWARRIAWACVLPPMTLLYWLAQHANKWGPRYFPSVPWNHPLWGFLLGGGFFGLIVLAFLPFDLIAIWLGRRWGVVCASCKTPLVGNSAQPWHQFEDHAQTVCSTCGRGIKCDLA